MKLLDFLEINNISLKRFAEKCEIPLTTMQSYLENKSEPGASNCEKIIQESCGAIKLIDLTKVCSL